MVLCSHITFIIQVATSSSRDDHFARKTCNNQELFNMFDNITCGDDAAKDAEMNECQYQLELLNGKLGYKNNKNNNNFRLFGFRIQIYCPLQTNIEIISSLEEFDPLKYGYHLLIN